MVIVRLALPECVAVSVELANSVCGSMESRWKFNLVVKSVLAPNMTIDDSFALHEYFLLTGNGLVPPASPENLTYFGTYLKRHPRLLC